MSDTKNKATYSGLSFETGISFRKIINGTSYYSVATRTPEGDISHTTKIIQASHRKWKKFFPAAGASNAFKMAIRKTLQDNNGRFDGEIELEENNISITIMKVVVTVCSIMIAFALVPILLTLFLPIQNTASIGSLETIITTGFILFCAFGLFAILNKKSNIAKYHGAEHKCFLCKEAKEPLTLENVKKHRRDTIKCGTCFISLVLILFAILGVGASFAFPTESIWMRVFLRMAALLASFLILKTIFKLTIHSKNKMVKTFLEIITAPGLFMQRTFSVDEPDDEHIEVAIVSMRGLMEMDAPLSSGLRK